MENEKISKILKNYFLEDDFKIESFVSYSPTYGISLTTKRLYHRFDGQRWRCFLTYESLYGFGGANSKLPVYSQIKKQLEEK